MAAALLITQHTRENMKKFKLVLHICMLVLVKMYSMYFLTQRFQNLELILDFLMLDFSMEKPKTMIRVTAK